MFKIIGLTSEEL